MASNFIPMLSSSPPPLDDCPDNDDEDDEFGTFTSANIPFDSSFDSPVAGEKYKSFVKPGNNGINAFPSHKQNITLNFSQNSHKDIKCNDEKADLNNDFSFNELTEDLNSKNKVSSEPSQNCVPEVVDGGACNSFKENDRSKRKQSNGELNSTSDSCQLEVSDSSFVPQSDELSEDSCIPLFQSTDLTDTNCDGFSNCSVECTVEQANCLKKNAFENSVNKVESETGFQADFGRIDTFEVDFDDFQGVSPASNAPENDGGLFNGFVDESKSIEDHFDDFKQSEGDPNSEFANFKTSDLNSEFEDFKTSDLKCEFANFESSDPNSEFGDFKTNDSDSEFGNFKTNDENSKFDNCQTNDPNSEFGDFKTNDENSKFGNFQTNAPNNEFGDFKTNEQNSEFSDFKTNEEIHEDATSKTMEIEDTDSKFSEIKANEGYHSDVDDFDDFQSFDKPNTIPFTKSKTETSKDKTSLSKSLGADEDEFDDFDDFQACSEVEQGFASFESAPVKEDKGSSESPEFANFERASFSSASGETYPNSPCLSSSSHNQDKNVDKLSTVMNAIFPPQEEPNDVEVSYDPEVEVVAQSIKSRRLWEKLHEAEQTPGLKFQWGVSNSFQQLLRSVNVDYHSILRTSSVPIFASGLSLLEPVKGQTGSANTESEDKVLPSPRDLIPPVEFDWNSSGLVNPLETAQTASILMDLSFLSSNTTSSSTSVEDHSFENELLKPSPASAFPESNKTFILEELLSKNICSIPNSNITHRPTNLSEEANSVLDQLPDLSYMRAKVLMFPISGKT